MTHTIFVSDIEIISNTELSIEEAKKYIDYVTEKNTGKKILSICINFDDDGENVDLSYQTKSVGFERIRRITGNHD